MENSVAKTCGWVTGDLKETVQGAEESAAILLAQKLQNCIFKS